MNEGLKKQEQEFRAHCKEEMARLQQSISKLKNEGGETELSERDQMILKRYEAGQEKLQKFRLLLVSSYIFSEEFCSKSERAESF